MLCPEFHVLFNHIWHKIFTFAGGLALAIVKGPLEAIAGIVYGILLGVIAWYLPPAKHVGSTSHLWWSCVILLYPRTTKLLGGYTGFTLSVRPSVRLSVHPSRIPCPLCSRCSFGWIHFIFTHLIKQLQKVCRVWSFLQNFKICIFGNFFKFVTLTLSCFHLGSDVNH